MYETPLSPIVIICVWVFCQLVCLFTICMPGVQRGQKRVTSKLKLQPPCGCWALNPGPLEEQPAFSITEFSLQRHHTLHWVNYVHVSYSQQTCLNNILPELFISNDEINKYAKCISLMSLQCQHTNATFLSLKFGYYYYHFYFLPFSPLSPFL